MTFGTMTGVPNGLAYLRTAAVTFSQASFGFKARMLARLVEDTGRRRVFVAGDLSDPAHCRTVFDRAAEEFGGGDILVSNAAYQMTHENLDEISDVGLR